MKQLAAFVLLGALSAPTLSQPVVEMPDKRSADGACIWLIGTLHDCPQCAPYLTFAITEWLGKFPPDIDGFTQWFTGCEDLIKAGGSLMLNGFDALFFTEHQGSCQTRNQIRAWGGSPDRACRRMETMMNDMMQGAGDPFRQPVEYCYLQTGFCVVRHPDSPAPSRWELSQLYDSYRQRQLKDSGSGR